MKRKWRLLPLLLVGMLVCACAGPAIPLGEKDIMAMVSPVPATPPPVLLPTVTPAPTAVPTPTAAPTPTTEPESVYVTLGAVGDIMVMQSQVNGAWYSEKNEYDFTPSFVRMQPYFESVDIMCANLETPLAGEAAQYSGPMPVQPTPDAAGTVPERMFQTFNAPDALATSLFTCGLRVVTTANNHCLDRGAAGLFRTVEVLRGAGLTQIGAFTSAEDRATARIIEENGIKIGLVAWTTSVNKNQGKLSSAERAYAVGRVAEQEMRQDIQTCREAGAEFIVAFLHWDNEFMSSPATDTQRWAKKILGWGVDAIIGAHPHVVQPVEYITVQRETGPYTGLVAYSLGNFISNMAPSPRDYGMLLKLTIEKTPEGEVRLSEAAILPVYCVKTKKNGRVLHEVLPAFAGADTAETDLQTTVKNGLIAAREHVLSICNAVPPLA